jgi:hypothetical protein
MKKALILALFLYCGNSFAQSTELGIGVGFSTNTSPAGNMEYKGDQMLLNYATTLKFLYTSKTNWQFGLDGHLLEISSKSSKKYDGFYNDGLYIPSVGGDDKKLVYSKYATSVCAVVNKKFLFANSTSMYAGVAVGYAMARNNSKKYLPNESYKGPDGGEGMVYGLQLGYLKAISQNVLFNIDIAMRYYNLDFDAEAPQRPYNETLSYSVVSFPVTIGIRYMLYHGDEETKLRGTYNIRRNRYY